MAAPQAAYTTRVDLPDVVLIGSGIMSATLGAMLKVLRPEIRIQLYEAAGEPAQESSHGWNNAGTGHAGLCELSYTPHRRADGTVDVTKAIQVFEEFEISRRFWAFAVEQDMLPSPADFIRPVPHISFVAGEQDVEFLRARHQALVGHPFFQGMEFTTDAAEITRWAPLLMEGRSGEAVAATRAQDGTDVNFGALARGLVGWLARQPGCGVLTAHRVRSIRRDGDGWRLGIRDVRTRALHDALTPFVFIGAGGGSLPLLQQSGIPESRGIGGFPIGGRWLICDNPEIVARHNAKVYGQALGAAPTMAVPHLDTRILDSRRVLLFGPFAAWTSKFLHGNGSRLDLPRSVKPHNARTLAAIGIKNLDLIRYLLEQGRQSDEDRLRSLRAFYPGARSADWRLIDAGIRVQAIKSSEGKSGIVHYGTEIVTDGPRSIAALLGASPGASVSASIALQVIERCLPQVLASEAGRSRLRVMAPTHGMDSKEDAHGEAYREAGRHASRVLQL